MLVKVVSFSDHVTSVTHVWPDYNQFTAQHSLRYQIFVLFYKKSKKSWVTVFGLVCIPFLIYEPYNFSPVVGHTCTTAYFVSCVSTICQVMSCFNLSRKKVTTDQPITRLLLPWGESPQNAIHWIDEEQNSEIYLVKCIQTELHYMFFLCLEGNSVGWSEKKHWTEMSLSLSYRYIGCPHISSPSKHFCVTASVSPYGE